MKYVMIGVCVFSVGWAVVNRLFLTKVDQYGERVANVEVPKNAGPTYVSMESGGPVYRLTPDTRKQVDRFSSEKVVMFGAPWCGSCAANRQILPRAACSTSRSTSTAIPPRWCSSRRRSARRACPPRSSAPA